METNIAQNFQHSRFFELDTFTLGFCRPLNIPRRFWENRTQSLIVSRSRHCKTSFLHQSIRAADVSYPLQDISVSNVVGKSPPSHASVLKNKIKEVVPYLNGRSIYLVGMMGCGKTTVGKILSELLGYSFIDSDTLVEQTLGHISVAEIFKLHGEGFFRDKESEVMWDLSLRHRLVVSTGGGVVVRSLNWEYMRKGISVWLDVPLKALAQRIAAVGTNSRPLLHVDSDDIVAKTFSRLSDLWEERGESYTNADARVSLECIANRIDLGDISKLTPPVIAIEHLNYFTYLLAKRGLSTNERWTVLGSESLSYISSSIRAFKTTGFNIECVPFLLNIVQGIQYCLGNLWHMSINLHSTHWVAGS